MGNRAMDWKATLAEIVSDRQRQLGERPSMEQMFALRAGELSEAERDRLLERAAWDPEVARELFDLMCFPDLPRGGKAKEAVGNDAGLDQRWQALRARLRSEGILPEMPSRAAPSPEPQRVRVWRWLPMAASFAAGLALAITIGVLRPAAHPESPGQGVKLNLPVVELVAPSDTGPDARRGGGLTAVPPNAGGIVLTLAAPGLALSSGPYDLEIRRGRQEVFRSHDLVPGEGGVFVLLLPRERLADGAHEIILRDASGRTVASFRLDVKLVQ